MKKIALLVSLLSAVGCGAGGISGEVDGETVPGFGNASFGIVTEDDAGAIFAAALPRDSCKDGSEVIDTLLDNSSSNGEPSAEERAEASASFINEIAPEGSWYLLITFFADDKDDIETDTLDLEDIDNGVQFTFGVCFQDDEAEADGGVLDDGADCFRAAEGDLDVELDAEASRFRVFGQQIELRDEDDDDAGEVDVDVNFARCEDIDDALDDLVTPDESDTPAPPP